MVFLTVIDVLLTLQAIMIFGIIVFTLGFAATSLKEREPRAAFIAAVLSLALLAIEAGIYCLFRSGFFFTPPGGILLLGAWTAAAVGGVFLLRCTGPNPGALKGVAGYITGGVSRFDEREQVFARERAIRPGTDDYQEFYKAHPNLEEVDAKRRTAGGILGTAGIVDRPREVPNVSAMLAAFSIPPHFGHPASYHPETQTDDDQRKEVNGTLRWKLNAETCFAYWAKVGTDCNVCMRVCPWSHPRTFPHRVVISLVARNKWARRLFFYMDDIFYGKKPRSKPTPNWAQYN